MVLLGVVAGSACVSREEVAEAREQAARVQADLAARADETDRRIAEAMAVVEGLSRRIAEAIAALPAGDPAREAMEAEASAQLAAAHAVVEAQRAEAGAIRASASAAAAAVETLDGVIAEYDRPTEPLGRAAQAVLPWVPTPYREPLMVGAAGLAMLARARKLKLALVSIVKGFESPEFGPAIKAKADALRAGQTATARVEVDRVQGKATGGVLGLLAKLPI